MDSFAFLFLSVLISGVNTILIGILMFFIKQPDPYKSRVTNEIHDLNERVLELSKAVVTFEKKIESLINDSKNENLSKLIQVRKDVGKQLQEIHDNL